MRITPYCLIVTVLLAVGVQARAADTQDSAALAAVLRSDAPKAEKAITCKQLAVFGNEDAVPALAPLLEDPELNSWARIALEAIPGAAADKALRDAMGKVNGRLLIGVINSLAVRRDAEAVDALAQQMKGADAGVASAAAAALGRIGTPKAAGILEAALADAPKDVRSGVAEGCIHCAEQLLAAGKRDEAAALYDRVRQAEVPKPRIVEATRGAIVARQADGVPLLMEQLQSTDKTMFWLGLTTARELTGKGVAEALVAKLGELPADRQSLVILALADRGDVEVLPAMLKAVAGGPDSVRVAAIGAVKQLGDVSCIPVLLEAAARPNEAVAQAAREALEKLPGDGVDKALAARLKESKGAARKVLISVVGERRIAVVPVLLEAADDPDAGIRAAALTALGQTAGLDDVSVLIQRVVAPKHPEDRQPAEKALVTACVRMPDRDACADKLVAAMPKAAQSEKVTLLKTLGSMQGTAALQAIGAAAKQGDPELQDAASRLLGTWMTVDAAPVLLDLATSDIDAKYKIRALRGFIRIVRQFDVPAAERVRMCQQALEAAQRNDEKKLVLEVLQRYPSVDSLRLAVAVSKVPALADDAKASALAIAQKIGGSADVGQLLAQAGQEPVKIEILKAEYGADTKQKDVTEAVRKSAGSLTLIVLPSASYNESFGGDPVPGVVKQLKIQYRINDKAGEATFAENATIILPMPK